ASRESGRRSAARGSYRAKGGRTEARVVWEGPVGIGPGEATCRAPAAGELGQMMTDHFLPPDNVVLDQNVLVINAGDTLALFETGMSSVKRTDAMGRLAATLKQSGIDPADIDAVIPTHAHIAHVGGIMAPDRRPKLPTS